jgi:HPt (histidine-containing phosphotransfer) domain-containing protein
MTGYDTPADRAMCLAAGMTTFLAKPVTPEQLRSLLATVHGTVSLLQPAAARSTETDRCGERAAFDTSIIDALPMVADGSEPGFAAELLAIFVRRTRQLLTELGAASTASDRQEMVRCAHTMKSSSAIIGALALADRARTYEMRLRAGETPAHGWLDLLQRDFAHFETAAQRYLAANGSSGMRAG